MRFNMHACGYSFLGHCSDIGCGSEWCCVEPGVGLKESLFQPRIFYYSDSMNSVIALHYWLKGTKGRRRCEVGNAIPKNNKGAGKHKHFHSLFMWLASVWFPFVGKTFFFFLKIFFLSPFQSTQFWSNESPIKGYRQVTEGKLLAKIDSLQGFIGVLC